jgi:pseudouridine-5'-phosphate glycosidase
MLPSVPETFVLSADVRRGLNSALPIVALESTVITHGLPHPQNLSLANDMEQEIRNQGVIPATVALLEGQIHIGLTNAELEQLATKSQESGLKVAQDDMRPMIDVRGEVDRSLHKDQVLKISLRDFATAIVLKQSGGTTAAGTLFVANRVGIKVFATGGIGGVHEVETLDISTDLQALAKIPLVVVCAGAKAILNLPATLEYLETMGVPVVGYQTDEFPAFYSRQSGLPVSVRLESPKEVAEFARAHWAVGMQSAVLVCQPLPESAAVPPEKIEGAIQQARREGRAKKIRGQQLTPFLLERLVELTEGASLRANLALLLNNARLAAGIARALGTAQWKNI